MTLVKKRLKNKRFFKISIILIAILIVGIIFVGYNILEGRISHAVDSQKNPEEVIEPPVAPEEENKDIIDGEDIVDENILDPIEPEKPEESDGENIIKEKFEEGKVAYLTIDDGPSVNVTPMVLEILNNRGIKATFFIIGSMAEENPHVLKRVYGDGHVLGNHTYSHNYAYIYKNTKNFSTDIIKWEDTIKDILGQDFKTDLFRFPGGSFHHEKKYLETARKLGYNIFDWNVINGDGEYANPTSEMLIQRFKETIIDKRNPIILLHDTDAKLATVESLEEIIDYLLDEGFVFDTLNYYNER